jgi:hypothetical protein
MQNKFQNEALPSNRAVRRLRLQTAHRRRALTANSFPAITAPIGLLTPCVAEKRHADEF